MKSLKKILLLVLSCALLASCGKIGEINLTSYKVASVSPVGLRGLDVAVDLGIDNPALQFTVSDIDVEIFHNDGSLGTFKSDAPMLVKARTVGNYRLTGRVQLSSGVSLMHVLGLVNKFNPDEFTISYKARVTVRGGGHVTLSKRKVPLNELLEDSGSGKKNKK